MRPHPPTIPNCPEVAAGLCRPKHIAWSAATTRNHDNNHAKDMIIIINIIVNDNDDCDNANSMVCSNNIQQWR